MKRGQSSKDPVKPTAEVRRSGPRQLLSWLAVLKTSQEKGSISKNTRCDEESPKFMKLVADVVCLPPIHTPIGIANLSSSSTMKPTANIGRN
jgi:hypothetical protein